MPARVADVAVRLVQLTKRFGGDTTGKRVAKYVEGADPSHGFLAVDHIDLDVNEGEFFSLLGPSGCGKTTTLRMIGGFEQPTDGHDRAPGRGRDLAAAVQAQRQHGLPELRALPPPDDLRERRLRAAPQEGRGRRGQAARHARCSSSSSCPATRGRKPGQISGGQAQRVALARALVNKPAVLLLDEPLGALDLKLRKQMQVELKRIQQEVGITFIYVTHDQEEAMTMSDRIAVMNKGKYEQLGDPEALYERPTTRFVAGFLGVSNLLPGDGRRPRRRLRRRARSPTGPRSASPRPWSRAATVASRSASGPRSSACIEPDEDIPAGHQPPAPASSRDASYLGVSTQYIVELAGRRTA